MNFPRILPAGEISAIVVETGQVENYKNPGCILKPTAWIHKLKRNISGSVTHASLLIHCIGGGGSYLNSSKTILISPEGNNYTSHLSANDFNHSFQFAVRLGPVIDLRIFHTDSLLLSTFQE